MPDDDEPDEPSSSLTPTRDPDVRFLLANERTLLAWIRTGLAVIAGGMGVVQFLPDVPFNDAIGAGLLILGALCFLVGLQRYRGADAAMRANLLPPKGFALDVIALILFVLAAFLIVLLMTHRATTI